MSLGIGGRLGILAALASVLGTLPGGAQDRLSVETRDGAILGALAFVPGQDICLTWAHSVTGGAVADCFAVQGGRLVLTRSYLHDFAAGLGEVAGRGHLTPAPGGGYWIDDINEAITGDALTLRIGAPRVGHVLRGPSGALALSDQAPGARVTLRLRPATP